MVQQVTTFTLISFCIITVALLAVVRSFLIKNPRARLCCREGIKELQALPFFAGLDWEAVMARRVRMPYKPDLAGATDISSFETTFTREAPVDSVGDASSAGGKASKKKSFIGMIFGDGSKKAEVAEDTDVDAFKGFAFAKDDQEDAVLPVAGSTTPQLTPPTPP